MGRKLRPFYYGVWTYFFGVIFGPKSEKKQKYPQKWTFFGPFLAKNEFFLK